MTRKIFPFQNLSLSRQTILTTLFIGITFLWTSGAYLAWSSHLAPLASDTVTYVATEAGGALMQAFGLLLFAWLTKYDFRNALLGRLMILAMLVDGCAILPVAFSEEMMSVLAWGLVMNLFHGAIAGYYITRLSCFIPANRRAFSFGFGYAFGSIGAYLPSLIGSGGFLATGTSWFYLAFFIAIDIGLYAYITRMDRQAADGGDSDSTGQAPALKITKNAISTSSCILAGAVVLLLGLTTQLLLFFPAQSYLSDTTILEFSHMLYAVGLIIAAIVNDKKRSAGLILALLSLCFPLLSLSLYHLPHMLTALSVIGYIVTGFYAVFRVVVFADLYDNDSRLLFLAPAGLLCGRLGETAGAMLGFCISSRHVLLTVVTALLFTATTILVFTLYVRHYGAKPATTMQERANRFYAEYELSSREQQVFLLLIDGKTNQEIATALFISENTVKFHVRNILKKTGCPTRTDIIWKFQSYS